MSKKKRILLVDDDPMNLKILQNILADDYDLELALSGSGALKLVEKETFDIILLDIMMPALDGYEVCQKMKEGKRSQFTKIILVSAKDMLADRLKGYTYGADDYVTKPFDENELLAKVRVYLKLKFTEELEQLKTTLLSSISHRIRIPLNSILGFSSILEENSALDSLGKMQLKQIIAGGKQLLDFTQKSILFCELTSGIRLTCKYVLLQEYIQRIIGHLQNKASVDQKKIVCSNFINEKISCDIYYLEIAFTFMLENIIKFSAEKSIIEVCLKSEKKSWEILIKSERAGVEFKSIEELSHVLLEDINEQDVDEDSMGFMIAHHIVTLHQGSVEVGTDSQSRTILAIKVPIVNREEVAVDETENSHY